MVAAFAPHRDISVPDPTVRDVEEAPCVPPVGPPPRTSSVRSTLVGHARKCNSRNPRRPVGMSVDSRSRPRHWIRPLGPAGSDLITTGTLALIEGAAALFLRTRRHPAAAGFDAAADFNHAYEEAEDTFDNISADPLCGGPGCRVRLRGLCRARLADGGRAERRPATRPLRGSDVSVGVQVHPSSPSLDLDQPPAGEPSSQSGSGWSTAGGAPHRGAGNHAAGGPVRRCSRPSNCPWKPPDQSLHHLGRERGRVGGGIGPSWTGPSAPDHTSLWIPQFADPCGAELLRTLDELVHVLRQRCPWDRRRAHRASSRYLEVLEAIDAVAAFDDHPRRFRVGPRWPFGRARTKPSQT